MSTPALLVPPSRVSVWVRLIAAIALAALVIASLAYLGVRWARDGAGSVFSSSASTSLAGERDAAMSQARQFALRLNTYGPELLQGSTMPAYRTQVEQVITDSYKADFEQGAALPDATVSQTGIKASAQVYATGVAAMGDDSATVLVTGDLTYAYPKSKGSKQYVNAADEPFRWEVEMEKVNGTWLVNGFNPAEGGSVSTTTQGDGAQ